MKCYISFDNNLFHVGRHNVSNRIVFYTLWLGAGGMTRACCWTHEDFLTNHKAIRITYWYAPVFAQLTSFLLARIQQPVCNTRVMVTVVVTQHWEEGYKKVNGIQPIPACSFELHGVNLNPNPSRASVKFGWLVGLHQSGQVCGLLSSK